MHVICYNFLLARQQKFNTAVLDTPPPVRWSQVVPYTFVRSGVPVREDTYAGPSACEVGSPVPFLAAFISPVFPLGTHLLMGEQWASVQLGHRVGLEPQTFRMGGMRSDHYANSLRLSQSHYESKETKKKWLTWCRVPCFGSWHSSCHGLVCMLWRAIYDQVPCQMASLLNMMTYQSCYWSVELSLYGCWNASIWMQSCIQLRWSTWIVDYVLAHRKKLTHNNFELWS